MPLTKGQIAALEVLAASRDPESYVAGSTPLSWTQPRISDDIDIFHDREERVALAAEADAATLSAHGFSIKWIRRLGGIHTAIAERDGEVVKLEWIVDSDFRFFPATKDALFGYKLHPIDLATNKVQAAANRREVRDIVDLVSIHENVLPLGAAILAAAGKSPGFTPEGLIGEIRRNSNYPAEEWRLLSTATPVDPATTLKKLRDALDDAEDFVRRMPTSTVGTVFLSGGKVVQPAPDKLDDYQAHMGRRGGHWPSSPEIAAALMESARDRSDEE